MFSKKEFFSGDFLAGKIFKYVSAIQLMADVSGFREAKEN